MSIHIICHRHEENTNNRWVSFFYFHFLFPFSPSLPTPLWFLSWSVLCLLAGKRRDNAIELEIQENRWLECRTTSLPSGLKLHSSSITDMACMSPGSLRKICSEDAAVLRNLAPLYTSCFDDSYHAFNGTIQPSPVYMLLQIKHDHLRPTYKWVHLFCLAT